MTTLKAEKRSLEIKAKKLRRQGLVTGNVFGKGMENSLPIQMDVRDAEKLLRTNKKGSRLTLDVDGTKMNVLLKEYDFNALKNVINEMDFQVLVQGEMVHSVAEIVVVNHEMTEGGVLQQHLEEISYRALPDSLVETIEVDASKLKLGDTVRVKDLAIASDKNVHLMTDPEEVVVSVTAVHNDVPETEATETAAPAAAEETKAE
ncbi:MAG: 50S ribosomal protein L25 [Eubacteriales bacterium]|nr:50S ribosomal protein L25 [Eubacteriales bacterium]